MPDGAPARLAAALLSGPALEAPVPGEARPQRVVGAAPLVGVLYGGGGEEGGVGIGGSWWQPLMRCWGGRGQGGGCGGEDGGAPPLSFFLCGRPFFQLQRRLRHLPFPPHPPRRSRRTSRLQPPPCTAFPSSPSRHALFWSGRSLRTRWVSCLFRRHVRPVYHWRDTPPQRHARGSD